MDANFSEILEWQSWLYSLMVVAFFLLMLFRNPNSIGNAIKATAPLVVVRRRLVLTLELAASFCVFGLGISLVFLPSGAANFVGGLLMVFGFQLWRAIVDWSHDQISDRLDAQDQMFRELLSLHKVQSSRNQANDS